MTETKYPFCEQAGLFHMNRVGEVIFNSNKFFAGLSYSEFLIYELGSSYPKIKVDEIEDYLANR